MNDLELQILPIHPDFMSPTRSTDGAAGIDFYAVDYGEAVPGELSIVPLGLAMAFSPKYAMLLTTRSGHGKNYGAGVPHGYGLIDSDFRGELLLVLTTMKRFTWVPGERIAQGLFVEVPKMDIKIVSELPKSVRGEGGFGSTGK